MARRVAVAAVLAACLGSCGLNLSVLRLDTEVRTTDGRVVPVRIDRHVPYGGFHADTPPTLWSTLLAIPLEPLDWLATAIGAGEQLLNPGRRYVLGGPAGYLAALTPFATTVGAIKVASWPARDVPPDLVLRLRSDDPEVRAAAARQAFRDDRIVGLTLRQPHSGAESSPAARYRPGP